MFRFSSFTVEVANATADKHVAFMLKTLATNRHIVTKNLLNYCMYIVLCVCVCARVRACEFMLSYVLRMLFFQCVPSLVSWFS